MFDLVAALEFLTRHRAIEHRVLTWLHVFLDEKATQNVDYLIVLVCYFDNF